MYNVEVPLVLSVHVICADLYSRLAHKMLTPTIVPGKWHNSMNVTIATFTVDDKHVDIVNQAFTKKLLYMHTAEIKTAKLI